MGIKPKSGLKSTASSAAAAAADVATSIATGAAHVTLSRKYTIPGRAEFESISFQATVTAPTYAEASDMIEEIMVAEAEKAGRQFIELRDGSEAFRENLEADAEEEGAEDDEASEGEEEEGVDEETILAMDLKQLKSFITDNELDIDPSEYKTAKKLGPVVWEAIVASQEEGGEEGEEEDAEGDEADESGEEADESGEEEEAGIDPDEILAMNRAQLLKFAGEQELEVEASDYPKTKAGSKKLAEDIIEALSGGEEADESGEEADESADEEAGEEAADESSAYTRKELEGMKNADLEAIWDDWKIKGPKPKGSAPVIKKSYVNKILAAQEG